MHIPSAGQPVTVDELVRLAIYYDKLDIVAILSTDPPKDIFVPDGCTMFPDVIAGQDLYPACFWHDARYWCGLFGDYYGRVYADTELARDVTIITGSQMARTMFFGVSVVGRQYWGHGR